MRPTEGRIARRMMMFTIPVMAALLFPGCIAVGLSSAKADRELLLATSSQVRQLEDRVSRVERVVRPSGEMELVEQMRRLEREIERLREENKRLSESLAGEPTEE
jgi:ABC-type phosphate transport system auxiliary subunit